MKLYEVDYKTIVNIPVPPSTDTYKAVSVKSIIDSIYDQSKSLGYQISKESFVVRHNGQKQLLRFGFDTGDSNHNLEIAVLNSYDKSMAFKMVSGASVRVCFNGMVIGDVKNYSKHTGEVQSKVLDFVNSTFSTSKGSLDKAQELWNYFNDFEINEKDTYEIIGELFMTDLLNTEQINIVKKEVLEPSFDYKDLNPASVNKVYQAITFAQKKTHPLNWLSSRGNIQNYFVKNFAPKSTIFIDKGVLQD